MCGCAVLGVSRSLTCPGGGQCVRRPKWGVWLLSACALSFADSSGGCLCWLERARTKWPRQLLFSGGELVFILLADFCRELSRLNVLKKKHSKMASKKDSEVQTSEDLIQEVNVVT